MNWFQAIKTVKKTQWMMAIQEINGFAFDELKGRELLPVLEKQIKDIEEFVEPQLPPRRPKLS